MSQDASPYDAYQPPPMAEDAQPARQPVSKWLTAICIIAIVLGSLGILGALMGLVGLAFGSQIQGAFGPGTTPGMPQEAVEVQQEMQAEMQALQDRFLAANATLAVIQIAVALALLVGGIQCLRRIRPGRIVLLAGCAVAIAFEIARAIVQSLLQWEMASVMTGYMKRIMESSGGGSAPQAAEFMMSAMRFGMILGVCLGLAWVAIKLVFYGLAIHHLRKPHIRTHLEGA